MPYGYGRALVHTPGKPVWSAREYGKFAEEAYIRNVIAHQCIAQIARAAASVPFRLYFEAEGGARRELHAHPLLTLLKKPNPCAGGTEFFEAAYSYRLIAGNTYILATGPEGQPPQELHLLRPDRVQVIAGQGGIPAGYRYTVGEHYRDYLVDRSTCRSRVLHLKVFHPLNDWYGLSPIESAAYSIDQHNDASAWNKALLQNGARPSGALVVKAGDGQTGSLSEEQYGRLKEQIDQEFAGSANAGRPILLEGGLEWREMSLSPRDMDFTEARHGCARDIALAFGVPPQLLGIPGDNTYANLAEARLAFWEQTILPMLDGTVDALNNWLSDMFDLRLVIGYRKDDISALAPRREKVWDTIKNADFLTREEKRRMVGVGEEISA